MLGSAAISEANQISGRIWGKPARTSPNRAEVEHLTWPSAEVPGQEAERRRLELAAQDVGKSAITGFDDGAGVVCDQPA